MRIGITTRFINSYFSGSLPQQALAIGKALSLAGHSVTHLYPKGEPAWFVDVASAKEGYNRQEFSPSDAYELILEVSWALQPADRKGKVISFVHYPPVFFDMESSVYNWNPVQRNFQNVSAIWTYDHYSSQDVRYLEFLSGVKVHQIPYIWNPDLLDVFLRESSLPTWMESAKRVDALIPPESSSITSWCARIVESNFSNSSHCVIPLNIVSQIRSRSLPIRFTVHNGDQTAKSDFFKNNVVKNLILPDISGNIVPRVRLPDLLRDKTLFVAHQRFRPLKSYMLDAYYLGIPLIHNCEILRDLGVPYFYELNQINQAADTFVKMVADYESLQGVFDPTTIETRRSVLRERFAPNAVSDAYANCIMKTVQSLPTLQPSPSVQPSPIVKPSTTGELRVAFCNMWIDFQPKYNFFMYLLSWIGKCNNVPVTLDMENPNLVITGPFQKDARSYPGVPKVFFTGENRGPDTDSDTFLNLGFRYDMGDSYIRVPLWILEINWWGADPNQIQNPKPIALSDCMKVNPELLDRKKKFCAFVASNPTNPTRNDAFQILNRWRPIDSAGRLFCNRTEGPLPCSQGGGGGELTKVEYYKDYQFALTFENTSAPGYTTEKLFHAKVAGCVPIYWGDAFVDRDFDPRGFINANQMGNAQGFINLVSKVVNDPEEWRKMASVPALSVEKKDWCERTMETVGKAIFKKILNKDIALTKQEWANASEFGKGYEGPTSNTVLLAANAKYVESAVNLLSSCPQMSKIVYIWPDVTDEHIKVLKQYGANEIRPFPVNDPKETPWPDYWEPQHFAWKLWLLHDAFQKAKDNAKLLYLDAGIVLCKPLDNVWQTIDEKGVFLLNDANQINKRWCHPTFCKLLNVIESELQTNQLWAGCIGFMKGGIFDTVIGNAHDLAKQRDIIVGNKWQPYTSECMGHRHDQSILSILTSRLCLGRQPLDTHYCDKSLRATVQKGVTFYVHRGQYKDLVPFSERIDEAYVINLERRADRLKRFSEMHSNIRESVYVWKATNGKDIALNKDLITLFRNNDFSWKKAVMGCALSHYGLWQKLAADELAKSYLIMEDDVKLDDRWVIAWAQASASFPADADVVYLGGVLPPNKPAFPTIIDPVNSFFAKVKQNAIFGGLPRRYFHFCNYAYILTQQGAKKLCNLIQDRGIFTSGDHMIVNHGDGLLNIYFTTPLLATCYQENDPAYQTSQFNNFRRIDNFDSDLWNNDERFTLDQVSMFGISGSATGSANVPTTSPTTSHKTSPTNKPSHQENVLTWNNLLRQISRNERSEIPSSIHAIFQIWSTFTAEELQKHYGWFRVLEQLIVSKNATLMECGKQIRNLIQSSNLPGYDWSKILSSLPAEEPKDTLTVFHLPEVDPNGFLECDWLNSVMPNPISWKPLDNVDSLLKSQLPILLYNNIPGKNEFVKGLFQKLIQDIENAGGKVSILHLSDEFSTDDLSIYQSKAVKQVLRTYWRTDLSVYGDKVFVLPLGFTNGHANSNPNPSFNNRPHLWSFAGSLDRPGRSDALQKLRNATPFKEYSKENWSSPNQIQGPDYTRLLETTKFVPCFKGFQALESFRFYEALESGAIPVYVPSSSKDEYKELFGKHPFLAFPSWEKVAEVLPKLATQGEVMEKHRLTIQEWWANKKASTKTTLANLLTA
jgi:GR25 family glycosyltransferase involved in LPS biosynthesis